MPCARQTSRLATGAVTPNDEEVSPTCTRSSALVAAKIALHNFCMWLNEHLGRPRLAFTDLVDW